VFEGTIRHRLQLIIPQQHRTRPPRTPRQAITQPRLPSITPLQPRTQRLRTSRSTIRRLPTPLRLLSKFGPIFYLFGELILISLFVLDTIRLLLTTQLRLQSTTQRLPLIRPPPMPHRLITQRKPATTWHQHTTPQQLLHITLNRLTTPPRLPFTTPPLLRCTTPLKLPSNELINLPDFLFGFHFL